MTDTDEYKLARLHTLNETYVMLGQIEESFGRHSRHKGAMLTDKFQREILKEIEPLRHELRTKKIIK